jgi:large subunit ribosomal protein L29
MKKTAELKELKTKDEKALIKELSDLNKKMVDLKFGAAFRKLKNFHEITATRKRIARIWTVLSELAEQKLKGSQ